ncbi:hypothetical protein BD560DRAFT_378519 [Blakeslea trispora]|nr:hypothetical protein BD560DRAFT_378519 [Blakeslea trispora]
MDNINEKTVSFVQQPKESTTNNDDEEIITQLTLAGLQVLMVRKRDQIIYKLPDNMQVTSIGEEQRQQLMKEIQTLHQATMAAASAAQQQQQQQQSLQNDIKPIAPKTDAFSSLDTPPQPTAAEADAMKETARKLREELEQQRQQQQLLMQQQSMMRTTSYDYGNNSLPNSPQDGGNKTTRKYNKTGKYSKKKQHLLSLQQQLQQQNQHQQQMTQQQLLALQQSLQPTMNAGYTNLSAHTSASSTPLGNSPFAFPQVQPIQNLSHHSSPVSHPTVTPPLSTSNQSQAQSSPSSPAQQQQQPMASPVTQKTPSIVQKTTQAQQPPADSILSKRLPEEELQHREVKKRFIESLLDDHKLVTTPDYKTPFKSLKDAVNRLMPFHIYQYPKHDLDANKIPLERQDHTMIEIFKCQTDLFEKYAAIVKKTNENGPMTIKIFGHREVVASQRQKLTEEQSRVAAEQAAQHQEMLRVQAEKARLAAEEEARQQQQQQQQLLQQQPIQPSHLPQQAMTDHFHLQPSPMQPMQSISPQQQVMQALQPQQVLQALQPQPQQATSYADGLAQANALLQNPQFLNHYNQLSPELQQRLLRNREQLVALLEKQQFNVNNNMNST